MTRSTLKRGPALLWLWLTIHSLPSRMGRSGQQPHIVADRTLAQSFDCYRHYRLFAKRKRDI